MIYVVIFGSLALTAIAITYFDAKLREMQRLLQHLFHPPIGFILRDDQALIPKRAKKGDVGYDLFSCEDARIPPNSQKLVRTGVTPILPPQYMLRIAPRSGLALNNGIDTRAGVIDSEYRGEIGVILRNDREIDFVIKPGDRIAQAILQMVAIAEPYDFNAEPRGYASYVNTLKNAMKECGIQDADDSDSKRPERGTSKFGSSGR